MTLQGFKYLISKYPITRGMLMYAIIWPSANVVQQHLTSEKEELDVKQIIRYGLFGSLFTAPTIFIWMRISSKLIKGQSLIIGLKKAMIEQVSYGPFALSTFLIGMAALEGKSYGQITDELETKFFPTWKSGACFWPVVQTINFAFIKEKNRVMFTAVFSFIWTCYLSWVKSHPVNTFPKTELPVIPLQPIIQSKVKKS